VPQHYDVVIVGGGHNGLAAGCYLAREGLRVVVVEKEERLGGMALTAPLIDEAPGHLVSPCAFEDLFFRIGGVVGDLDLVRHGFREYESDGWAWLGEDGASLLIQRDVERTVANIAQFSRVDAARYRELMEVAFRCVDIFYGYLTSHPTRPGLRQVAGWMRTLVTDRKLRSALAGMVTSTAVEVITSTFESDAVRGVFANTILGSPFADGNGITIMNTTLLHRTGIGRPVGGMGGVVAALERCLLAHGGETRTGSPVAEIEVRGGRAAGVALADGTRIEARRGVITTCPPQLVPGLVGDAFDDRVAARLESAPDDAWGIGQMTVTVALSEQLALPLHQARRDDVDIRRPTLMTGTLDRLVDAAQAAMRGGFAPAMPWWATIFNAVDPSQAPEGQDVVDLYCPAVPSQPLAGWQAERAGAADRLVAQASTVLEGLSEYELGRYIETPADRAERVGTRNGCIYHVDFLPSRVGPLRPALGLGSYRTPVDRLYLSGIGTHPPAGVSGLNGKQAAETVLKDLGLGRRRRGAGAPRHGPLAAAPPTSPTPTPTPLAAAPPVPPVRPEPRARVGA
jgi:phytoene dehydrogenase-like protein